MASAAASVSIGDRAVMIASLPKALSEVWIDRDLGWLDFNERVLAEALDERTPLLERAKFLAIFTSNMDEYFMKRVAAVRFGDVGGLVGRIRGKLLPMLVLAEKLHMLGHWIGDVQDLIRRESKHQESYRP